MGQRPTKSHCRIKVVNKICVGYQQEGIDPPSGEKPANYGQT